MNAPFSIARVPAISFCFFLTTFCAFAADRPNIVLVMSDDQGYGDFGVMGNPVIETPNIDAMAKRSASMSTFYVSPVCSPTRACLMTGRYNYRTRVVDTYVGRSMLEPEEVTIAEVLSSAGYATGIFGKWHLGDCYPMRPMDQGFDESLVLRGGGLAQPSEPLENERRYTNPILFHNGEQVQTKGYCTDVYFDAALDFIEDAHRQDRPFFTYLATNAPHGPFHDVPEKLREYYSKKDLAKIMVSKPRDDIREELVDTLNRIAAMITNIDQNIGRLFAKLDELDLTENTLVIFLVDNGPNTLRYVGPLRGMKGDVHEGGVRSPLWLHWPARLKPNTVRNEVAAHIDLMPTILEACGVDSPENVSLDGRSLLPLLESDSVDWSERTLAFQWHRGDRPMRYHHFMLRDSRWKLLNNSNVWSAHLEGPPRFELYDLLSDPGEVNDLAKKKPEIVARLKHAYDQWFDNVSGTRPDNYAPPRIVLGTEYENPTVLTRQDWRSDDGWGNGSFGSWKTTIAQAGKYNFLVRLQKNSSSRVVELRAAGAIVRQQLFPNQSSCEFHAVELPAGNTELQGLVFHKGKNSGVYQMEISRRK